MIKLMEKTVSSFLSAVSTVLPVSNYVAYTNPNEPATMLLDPEIRNNQGRYLSEEARKHLFVLETLSSRTNRRVNRMFAKLASGQ